jgi:uncharacterized protein (DUF4415 family)
MKEKKPNIVRFELGKLPEGFTAMPTLDNAPIDYSDIPELSDEWFEQAVRAADRPGKRAISLRVDQDVLDFFKAAGGRYQSRMNAVLRAYMVAQRKVGPPGATGPITGVAP